MDWRNGQSGFADSVCPVFRTKTYVFNASERDCISPIFMSITKQDEFSTVEGLELIKLFVGH